MEAAAQRSREEEDDRFNSSRPLVRGSSGGGGGGGVAGLRASLEKISRALSEAMSVAADQGVSIGGGGDGGGGEGFRRCSGRRSGSGSGGRALTPEGAYADRGNTGRRVGGSSRSKQRASSVGRAPSMGWMNTLGLAGAQTL